MVVTMKWLPCTTSDERADYWAQRIRIDRAKPRSDPFVGRARPPQAGASLANIFFWIDPGSMNSGKAGAGTHEVPLRWRQRFRASGGFCVSGSEFGRPYRSAWGN